jgi:hypothetical protein
MPTPVRYSGMPASRWWEFEDEEINLGDIDAGPADLARLLVAEFATAYGDDWFVIPVKVPVGTLTEIGQLEVFDTFGGRHVLRSTAFHDSASGTVRAWRFGELTGDRVDASHPSPWLLVAPTVVGGANGPALEQVLLARDEGANLAWAIEKAVEGPLGRPVERLAPGRRPIRSAETQPAPAPGAPRSYEAQWWRYRLEAPAPW